MSEPQEKIDISDLKETFLECPVCVEHFNQTDKRPRLLHSCLHAFCTQCLDQLLLKEGKGQITCPLCRQVQKITGKVDALPADPVRSKLVDYVQIKHKKKVLCNDCEANDAVSRCQECQSYLCDECEFVHRRHRVSRDHTILSLEEVLQQQVKTLSKGYICPRHPKSHLEFYCATEEQLCCVSCTILDHKGHELLKLDDAAAQRKQDVETRLKEVRAIAVHLKKARKESMEQENDIAVITSKSLADIDSMFDDLKKVLDQRKRQLVTSVKDKSSSLLSVVQKTSAAHDHNLAIIESADAYYSEAKEKADAVEMLHMCPTIKRSLEGLKESQETSGFSAAVASFKFTRDNYKDAESVIYNVGNFHEGARQYLLDTIANATQFTVGFLTVSVYKADMTKIRIDAIVNGANGHLSHGGGLPLAIAEAAGQSLVEEGIKYVQENGIIPVTGVVATTPGNLPCKMVLHAVGPCWYNYGDHQKQRCVEDLCKTILRCLIEANNLGAIAVAVPPISSGIYRVPKDICCEAYVRATKLFGELVKSSGSLKEVHFVDIQENMVAMMHKAFLTFCSMSITATEDETTFMRLYKTKEKIVCLDAPGAVGGEQGEECAICTNVIKDPERLQKCGHRFCRGCIDHYFQQYKPVCPVCGAIYGALRGNMPPGTMTVKKSRDSLPDHHGCGRYTIYYSIPSGYQTEEHPNPGKRFKGVFRKAYLPQTKEGDIVLRLLKVTFDRGLTFTIGRSTTVGLEDEVIWNDLRHKTSDLPGAEFGYPDPGYFQRVKEEMAAKGVTDADID